MSLDDECFPRSLNLNTLAGYESCTRLMISSNQAENNCLARWCKFWGTQSDDEYHACSMGNMVLKLMDKCWPASVCDGTIKLSNIIVNLSIQRSQHL